MNSDSIGESEANQRPNLLAGQQLPPLPQQKRSRQKRDALLQAALKLFAQRGYEATTIEEIAHQAGVAVGGFYQHFASKQQLLLVLMDSLLEAAVDFSTQFVVSDSSHIYAVIEQVVRRGLLIDWAYVGAYRAWREATTQNEVLRELHEHIEHWTTRQIEMMLRPLLQIPGAREDVDVGTTAWIVSLLFWRLAEIPLQEPDAVITTITNMIYHTFFYE